MRVLKLGWVPVGNTATATAEADVDVNVKSSSSFSSSFPAGMLPVLCPRLEVLHLVMDARYIGLYRMWGQSVTLCFSGAL
jgi:hypothetical protein